MVKHKIFETEDEAINAAKKEVERACGEFDRRWLEASPPNSYNEDAYLVRVYVLEGSPPRGVVLFNRANQRVLGYDITGKMVASHRIDKFKEKRGKL